jgi:branched-chain amino acid transport system ATP-binding protein
MSPIALSVKQLSKSFAGLKALQDISFDLTAGCIAGLIGPNGAGKTTLLNCLSRIYTPERGSIRFGDTDMLRVPIHGVAGCGISRTFQNLELAQEQTVRENVMLSALRLFPSSLAAQLLTLPHARAQARRARVLVDELLAEFNLGQVADTRVSDLSYGMQKGVELVRAVAGRPRLLLLDEPAAGLNNEESRQLGETIRRLRERRGMTVLLVEHDMRLVMDICEEIVVLDHGRLLCAGPPDVVQIDQRVVDAYLGAEHA